MRPLNSAQNSDLLYVGNDSDNEVRNLITKAYPKATITEEWDCIHDTRYMVGLPDTITCMEWFDWLFKEGLMGVSFQFQLSAAMPSEEFAAAVKQWAKKLREEGI